MEWSNNVNENDKKLFLAATHGNPLRIQDLLEKGANVDSKDEHGDTPLLRAFLYGHSEVTKVLIANGADVNAQNKLGTTPLLIAAKHGDVLLCKNCWKKVATCIPKTIVCIDLSFMVI